MKLKHCLIALTAVLLGLSLGACSDDDDDKVWTELPDPIAMFIDEYWPGSFARSYSRDDDEYKVQIANGPELEFDLNYQWTDIDGNGLPLPQQLLYDQLPETLYDYLQSGSYLNQVFEIERDARQYKVELLNQEVIYIISTGTIRTIATSQT